MENFQPKIENENPQIDSSTLERLKKAFLQGGYVKLIARFNTGEELLNQGLLPLHACFTFEGIAIVGDSKSGKNYLANELGLKVTSNDFGLLRNDLSFHRFDILNQAQVEATQAYYIQDQNLDFTNQETQFVCEKSLKPIETVYLLSNDKTENRDIWTPSLEEVIQIIRDSHPHYLNDVNNGSYTKEAELVTNLFGKINFIALNSKKIRHSKTLPNLLKQADSVMEVPKISIVGLGRVTREIISQLIALDLDFNIGVFSENKERLEAYLRDCNSAIFFQNRFTRRKIKSIPNLESLLDADLLIVGTCDNGNVPVNPDTPERQRKLELNQAKITPLIDKIQECGFSGKMIMITNPVEDLCEYTYQQSQLTSDGEVCPNRLLSNQIVGAGPGLDEARARFILDEQGIPYDEIKVVGRHSDAIKINVYQNQQFLFNVSRRITDLVRAESKNIRNMFDESGADAYEKRTIVGPAFDVVSLVKNFNQSVLQWFSALQKKGNFSAVESEFKNIF